MKRRDFFRIISTGILALIGITVVSKLGKPKSKRFVTSGYSAPVTNFSKIKPIVTTSDGYGYIGDLSNWK